MVKFVYLFLGKFHFFLLVKKNYLIFIYIIFSTWSGPSWSPAQCISSLLISIQSLMSEKPYHNEPGFEHVCFKNNVKYFECFCFFGIQERTSGDSKTYNEIIKHETLRVAVCEMLENENSCPKQLR